MPKENASDNQAGNPSINKSGSEPPIQSQAQKKLEPEKLLFSWKALERPFQKRQKAFWVRIFAIAAIFGLIIYIAEGAMPVILLVAILFLFYILSTVEPPIIEYSITNKGVKIAGRLNDWQMLYRFWFSKRLGHDLIIFETTLIPGRLELVISSKDKDKLSQVLSKYIPQEESPSTNIDKASNWISEKILKSESS
ncbi:MAG: hypothetical protein US60_C0022G0022 [Microgenomates group bacterium GW2011_GWC1_37_8]|uniref:DUF5673 domain-containing protein n=1 Tax=Candidatus Woesebacteria bacterium GW2011_GWB1_38_8 TaxID=1618570 RepID=A0A0G0NIB9_9BACT|nr:MAG: hypothetical protein US60_C0022G0022 [Microgenomates group bacterium GW2011_GWC1_37_8]KKQ85619.1 MAG: hypothetical protein UT08_C0005G0070 [Candidatus Woesebacteria bacterium GW2011_GWB1_38_8]